MSEILTIKGKIEVSELGKMLKYDFYKLKKDDIYSRNWVHISITVSRCTLEETGSFGETKRIGCLSLFSTNLLCFNLHYWSSRYSTFLESRKSYIEKEMHNSWIITFYIWLIHEVIVKWFENLVKNQKFKANPYRKKG